MNHVFEILTDWSSLFSFQCWVSKPLSRQEEDNNKLWNRCSSIFPKRSHCRKGEGDREKEKERKMRDHWHSDQNISICVTHSYATSLTIPMKTMVTTGYTLFDLELFWTEHGAPRPEGQWETWIGNTHALCFSCDRLFSSYFEKLHAAVDIQWMLHYLGTQSTMQSQGWSIVMSNDSGRVWATGPLTAGGNVLIHIRKHQPYHMYIWHDPVFDIIWIFRVTYWV